MSGNNIRKCLNTRMEGMETPTERLETPTERLETPAERLEYRMDSLEKIIEDGFRRVKDELMNSPYRKTVSYTHLTLPTKA